MEGKGRNSRAADDVQMAAVRAVFVARGEPRGHGLRSTPGHGGSKEAQIHLWGRGSSCRGIGLNWRDCCHDGRLRLLCFFVSLCV